MTDASDIEAAIRKSPHDSTAWGALADKYDEDNRPGEAAFARSHSERLQSGRADIPLTRFNQQLTYQVPFGEPHDSHQIYIRRMRTDSGVPLVWHPAHDEHFPPVLVRRHAGALSHVAEATPNNVHDLASLMQPSAAKALRRAVEHAYPSEAAEKLARTGVRRLLRTPAESYAPSPAAPDIESLEAAVRADPQDAQSWSLLAIAYQALGRDGDAAEARALAGILAKLARPKPGEQIAARHLTGEAFRQREIEPKREIKSQPSDTYHTPIRSYKIDPQIAGTAFAYHLRQIAQSGKANTAALAEYALAGRTPPGVNGDVYRALGNRLRAEKHPLANAYDWSNKSRSLSVDNWLERFIRKNVQSHGKDDRSYFDAVRRQFGNGAGKNKGYHAFWSRLQKAADADAYVLDNKHREDFQQTIEDALHRISDRHFDRAYLARTGDVGYFDTHPPTGALRLHRAV